MKVKVTTSTLIELIQERKRRELEDYAAAVERYPEEEARYRDALIEALDRATKAVALGRPLPPAGSHWERGRTTRYVTIPVRVAAPEKPRRPDHRLANQRLRELRLESRETLLVELRDRDWASVL